MTSHSLALGAALGALLVVAVHSSSVLFVDNSQDAYILHGTSSLELGEKSLPGVAAALTGLVPPYSICSHFSEKIQKVLKPSLFKKPRAHVVLNVAGWTKGDTAAMFEGRNQRLVKLSSSSSCSDVVDVIADLAAANPEVGVTLLDYVDGESCVGNCMEMHLAEAAQAVNAKFDGKQLTFSSGVSLDLSQEAEKMFATELASLQAGVQQTGKALRRRMQLDEQQEDVELYEVSMVGIQALADKHGAASDVVAAAKAAVQHLLGEAVQQLNIAYDGDVTYQVALFDSAPERNGMKELSNWKDTGRRVLAAKPPVKTPVTSTDSADTPDALKAKKFSAKAAGFGAFLILLYFSLAAIYCMCYMPFKQDTLLYATKKTE